MTETFQNISLLTLGKTSHLSLIRRIPFEENWLGWFMEQNTHCTPVTNEKCVHWCHFFSQIEFERQTGQIHSGSIKGLYGSYNMSRFEIVHVTDPTVPLFQRIKASGFYFECEIVIASMPGTNQYWAMRVVPGSRKQQEPLMGFKLTTEPSWLSWARRLTHCAMLTTDTGIHYHESDTLTTVPCCPSKCHNNKKKQIEPSYMYLLSFPPNWNL